MHECYNQFLSIDGDRIGETLERLVLSEDLDAVRLFSTAVRSAIDSLRRSLEGQGCEIIFAEGDGILAASVAPIDITWLQVNQGDITFSAGVGDSPTESLLALKVAKGLGRCRIVVRGSSNEKGKSCRDK